MNTRIWRSGASQYSYTMITAINTRGRGSGDAEQKINTNGDQGLSIAIR